MTTEQLKQHLATIFHNHTAVLGPQPDTLENALHLLRHYLATPNAFHHPAHIDREHITLIGNEIHLFLQLAGKYPQLLRVDE